MLIIKKIDYINSLFQYHLFIHLCIATQNTRDQELVTNTCSFATNIFDHFDQIGNPTIINWRII